MNNSQAFTAVSSALDGMKSAAPTVEIRAHIPAGNGMERITADVYHTSESRANPALVLKQIGKKLNGQAMAVAGTFQSLNKAQFVERITGLVSINKQSIVPDHDMTGFRALSSNMFLDDEEGMWVLRRNEAGNVLIKSTGVEDDTSLANLLEATCSAGQGYASGLNTSLSKYAVPSVKGGDAVTYVDERNQSVFGFVVASVQNTDDIIVQSMDAQDPSTVKLGAVVEVHDTSTFPVDTPAPEELANAAVSSARGIASVEEIGSYYKRVFARSDSFYREFMKRARAHAFA